jgi:hypothetical protein
MTIRSTEIGTSFEKEIDFINQLGSFTGGVAQTTLGSAFTARPVLTAEGMPRVYEMNVPEGSARVIARIGATSDAKADLDLYLFDCTSKECVLKDFSQRDGSNEEAEVENPATGRWKVVIDPFLVPSGETSCGYQDIFTHRAFGMITPRAKPSYQDIGAVERGSLSVRIDAVPTGARYLVGIVNVMTEVGTNTGSEISALYRYGVSYSKIASVATGIIQLRADNMRTAGKD